MKIDRNAVDYFDRATRQGASGYVARRYEIYAYAALDNGVNPLPCNRFLNSIDWGISVEDTVENAHGTRAGVVMSAMRRMAAPGVL